MSPFILFSVFQMRPNRHALVVYQFSFSSKSGTSISVKFYRSKGSKFDGADHSAPSQLRREWAATLISNPKWVWTQLNEHPFLDFLKNNEFHYSKFLVTGSTNNFKIFIK